MRELSSEDINAINYITDLQPLVRLGKYEKDYLILDALEMPTYELEGSTMRIHDVVWGSEKIGDDEYDPLLIELARTPLFRRLQAVEQLTLGDRYATMPNTTQFSRWQHIWGSVVFVRKMMEGEDVSPRDKMVLQLRTLLSDVGHTAFSHLGDWLFQGVGGKEDLHDQDLKDLLEVADVSTLLNKYDIELDEVVFPDVEDWIEAPSPDLCVDRVDYGMREIMRWLSPTIPFHMHKRELADPKTVFEITEQNQLAFRDAKMARYFAAGFSLLPTEHWGHPVHRLQLDLLMSATRYALAEESARSNLHPRDAMYGIDDDFLMHFAGWDNLHMDTIMQQIAKDQRRIFSTARHSDLERIFEGIRNDEWQFPAFPNPLQAHSWQSEMFGKPIPFNLDLVACAEAPQDDEWRVSDNGLRVWLSPLKSRAVDPLVKTPDGSYERFSNIQPSYLQFAAGQKAVMAQGYEATIFMRPDRAEVIAQKYHSLKAAWPELIKNPRNKADLQTKINDTMLFAAGRRFDHITEL